MSSLYLTGHSAKVPLSTSDHAIQLQRIDSDHRSIDVVKTLNKEEPQKTPLYFMIAHFWAREFGTSVTSLRCLSVVISFFIFPAAYYLALMLFESAPSAWITLFVVATSPFHFLYAREVREYILWLLFTILQCATFLHALSTRKNAIWIAYFICSLLANYTFPLSALTSGGLLVFAALTKNEDKEGHLLPAAISSLGAAALTLPWFLSSLSSESKIQENLSWLSHSMPIVSVFRSWGATLIRVFYDTDYDLIRNPERLSLQLIPFFLLIGLIALAFLELRKPESKRVRNFLFCLGFPLGFFTISLDIIFGGHRSAIPRYHLPLLLIEQLVVIYFIANHWTSENAIRSRTAKVAALVLLGLSVASIESHLNSGSWWNKRIGLDNREIGMIIKEESNAILYSPEMGALISIARYSYPQLRLRTTLPPIQSSVVSTSPVFLLRPLENQLSIIRNDSGLYLTKLSDSAELWKVSKR